MKMIIALLPAILLSFQGFSQLKDTTLKEVVIKSKKPLIRQEADRIIYDLEADPQSKVSSVLEMMRKVPYLSVDADDNVLLKGSSGYKVFINGRPSGLVERNPKEVLRNIPASTIKSIEVITSPPSRYDAEGLAGIINIITVRQLYNGHKGSVNLNEKGPAGGPGTGGTFTLKQGKSGLSSLAGISRYKVPETRGMLERTTTGADPENLKQQTDSRTDNYRAYAGLELSYAPDSLDLFSAELSLNGSRSTELSTQTSSLTQTSYSQYYRLERDGHKYSHGLETTINYQRGFKADKERLLTFSYRYIKENNCLYDDIALSDKINYTKPDYRQYNSKHLAGHTLQVDYVQPVKNLVIEGGLKGNFRTNGSKFRYDNLNTGTGVYETDTLRSTMLDYRQDVLAVYNSYTYRSARWEFRTGIRAERTIILLGYSQDHKPLQQDYTNVLPAVVLNRKFKDNSNLSLTYSRRIQRPSATELNPFVDRSNPDIESGGNPYLKPITSDVYQLSYGVSAKAILNISVGGMFFNNVFSAFHSYDSSRNVTVIRQENYGSGRVLKTNMSLSYPAGANLVFMLNSDFRHVSVLGVTSNGTTVKNSGFDLYLYGSAGYSFKKEWRVNTDVTWKKGGILLPLGRTNGFIATSFSVSKDFLQSRLTVSGSVSNPFNKYRYTNERINSIYFLQTSGTLSYYRRFTLSLNYRFGKLKEEIRKNKRGIGKDEQN